MEDEIWQISDNSFGLIPKTSVEMTKIDKDTYVFHNRYASDKLEDNLLQSNKQHEA